MTDHRLFRESGRNEMLIVEAKSGTGAFNNSWKKPATMEAILDATGVVAEKEVKKVAEELIKPKHEFFDEKWSIRWLLINRNGGDGEHGKRISWADVLRFIYTRMRVFSQQKASHPQWDPMGRQLYDNSCRCEETQFVKKWEKRVILKKRESGAK